MKTLEFMFSVMKSDLYTLQSITIVTTKLNCDKHFCGITIWFCGSPYSYIFENS